MLEQLRKLLGDKNARVYLAILELQSATIADIAKQAALPRSSTYLIVEELKKRGFVSESSVKQKLRIVPEPPEHFLSTLNDKIQQQLSIKQELENKLPELQAFFANIPQKPKIKYYNGQNAIRLVLFRMLDDLQGSKGEYLNICQGIPDKKALLEEDPEFIKQYLTQKNKLGIKSKEIIEDTVSGKEYYNMYSDADTQIRLAPQIPEKITHHIDKYIWNDSVSIFNNTQLFAIVIEDKQIAENERITFSVLWNALKDDHYTY